ncbi:TPA: hypothetical protein U1B14_001145 [Streptococcus suis]|uniref:Uncharacterized protein n=1 Tax=Streptococcus suis TaxID=1307 RepID=A0A9X4MTD5_STRSU|nr:MULTISPECIES: hypothetical protein [Streptococcus]MBM7193295.1 hypothetical protein [Streptococcus suis]MBY0719946.1 hypothetical protein [Streptococcus sp. 2018110]MCO8206921.1 hypothetical protein [Streptococcus suis]MCO8211457.1 hypothetical protein [Streptococcus suis]MCO8225555.1 hypothetical protein [Streptococcus suis]
MQEKKRPRGRPATGKVRNKNITIAVTEQERETIKGYAKEKGISLTDILLNAVNKKV